MCTWKPENKQLLSINKRVSSFYSVWGLNGICSLSKANSRWARSGKRGEEEVENGVPPAPLHLGAVSASPNDFNIFRMFLALFPLIVDISGELLNDGLIARLSFTEQFIVSSFHRFSSSSSVYKRNTSD